MPDPNNLRAIPKGLRIGVHLPLAQGLKGALAAAKRLRLESVQIFSGNPRSFTPKDLDPEEADRFGEGLWQAVHSCTPRKRAARALADASGTFPGC